MSQSVTIPKRVSREGLRLAAEKVADELVKSGHIQPDDKGSAILDIEKVCRSGYIGDGYEIARDLENRAGWSCTFETAEMLDTLASHASDVLRKEQATFVAENDIQPPIALGTRVTIRGRETGIIDAVSEYRPASYAVKVDGDPRAEPPTNSRRLVYFDEVAVTP